MKAEVTYSEIAFDVFKSSDEIICPVCLQKQKVSDVERKKTVRCPHCGVLWSWKKAA